MNRNIILLLLFVVSSSVFGIETKGQLSLDTERTNGPVVGETYSAILTLVPFRLDMVTARDLEGKSFLDYFYVSRVLKIEASENNVDAIQVYMDLVIVKNYENQSFKIWSLQDRNIPVSFNLGNIKKTDLVIKKFITFNTSLNELGKWNWKMLLVAILVVFTGMGAYYIFKKKLSLSKVRSVDVAKELRMSKTHADFEWIYRNRKTLIHFLEDKPESLREFKELTRLVEEYQFQPSWKHKDITELLTKKNRVLESYRNGV